MHDNYGAGYDVDLVLTTREFVRMIREAQIDVTSLPEMEFDSPLGCGTGAGVILAPPGGVMEAALRSAYFMLTGENPEPDAFREIRIDEGWSVFGMKIADAEVKIAVSSGLGNARALMEAVRRGELECDFVEIMACPGGCAGGGGQPIHFNQELAAVRGGKLYALDAQNPLRFSMKIRISSKLMRNFSESLSEKAHHLLHTKQAEW